MRQLPNQRSGKATGNRKKLLKLPQFQKNFTIWADPYLWNWENKPELITCHNASITLSSSNTVGQVHVSEGGGLGGMPFRQAANSIVM